MEAPVPRIQEAPSWWKRLTSTQFSHGLTSSIAAQLKGFGGNPDKELGGGGTTTVGSRRIRDQNAL